MGFVHQSYVDVNLNVSHIIKLGQPVCFSSFNSHDLFANLSPSPAVFHSWPMAYILITKTNHLTDLHHGLSKLELQHRWFQTQPSRYKNNIIPSGRLLLLFMKNGGELLEFVHRETFRMPQQIADLVTALGTVLVAGAASVQSDQFSNIQTKCQ